MSEKTGSKAEIDELYAKLKREAEASGYHLNPVVESTRELVKGLIANTKRYGYQSCPCRLASGTKRDDLDIICPCDYRDPDLNDYNMCYCALYVSGSVIRGEKSVDSIPERRPTEGKKKQTKKAERVAKQKYEISTHVWRCRVCGYLCARDEPPETCPICKAEKDRFESFL